MAYFNWNDSKIWNIFSFSLPTRGDIPPVVLRGGSGIPPVETLALYDLHLWILYNPWMLTIWMKISTPFVKIIMLLSWSMSLSCKTKLCEKMFNYYNHHHHYWRRRQRQSLVHHQMCNHLHCYLDHQQGCQLVCWGELDPQTILALSVCLLPPSHAD